MLSQFLWKTRWCARDSATNKEALRMQKRITAVMHVSRKRDYDEFGNPYDEIFLQLDEVGESGSPMYPNWKILETKLSTTEKWIDVAVVFEYDSYPIVDGMEE